MARLREVATWVVIGVFAGLLGGPVMRTNCVGDAFTSAYTASLNGYPSRIAYWQRTRNQRAHVQAQALIKGRWESLHVRKRFIWITSKPDRPDPPLKYYYLPRDLSAWNTDLRMWMQLHPSQVVGEN